MQVSEIFQSMDGEVNRWGQGQLSTFVRLRGCNLACSFCFGVVPGRRIPKIMTLVGENRKLFDVKEGDVLLTFDRNQRLVETHVIGVYSRYVDEWYRIRINGKQYFVTAEHPFFTTRGLIPADQLKVGDMVLHSSSRDKIAFAKLGEKNPMKRKEVALRSTNNTDYEIGYNFWRGGRKDGKVLVVQNGFEVQEIKFFDRRRYPPSARPDPLQVYNLTCSPHNSYLIDYMWVHNCDTPQKDTGEDMGFDELTKEISRLECRKVTITGGEPLIQTDTYALIRWLLAAGYRVSIETNGTIAPPREFMQDPNVSWVFDYKLEFPSKMNVEMLGHILSYHHWIKIVVGNRGEYDAALGVRRLLRELGCKASMAFSSAFDREFKFVLPAYTLVDWLIEDKAWDVAVNIQIHKIVQVR